MPGRQSTSARCNSTSFPVLRGHKGSQDSSCLCFSLFEGLVLLYMRNASNVWSNHSWYCSNLVGRHVISKHHDQLRSFGKQRHGRSQHRHFGPPDTHCTEEYLLFDEQYVADASAHPAAMLRTMLNNWTGSLFTFCTFPRRKGRLLWPRVGYLN